MSDNDQGQEQAPAGSPSPVPAGRVYGGRGFVTRQRQLESGMYLRSRRNPKRFSPEPNTVAPGDEGA